MQPRFLHRENHLMDDFAGNLGFRGIVEKSFRILRSEKKTFHDISVAYLLQRYLIFAVFSPIVAEVITNTSEIFSSFGFLAFFLPFLIYSIMLNLNAVASIVTAVAQTYIQIPLNVASIITLTTTIRDKLFVTFLWGFLLLVVYNVAFSGLPFLVLVFLPGSTLRSVILVGLLVVYAVGSVYISVVVDFANVVTVLEEECGRVAILRSRGLLRGKKIITGLIVMALLLFYVAILAGMCFVFVANDNAYVRMWAGVAFAVVFALGSIIVEVMYTVLYINCKFFHKEPIDWSLLTSHLDAYLETI